LTIQEHTAWNRVLSENEIAPIDKHCDKWGYFITISKLQMIITDKQPTACHKETISFKEGRVITSRFQIAKDIFTTFILMYGVPHSGNRKIHSEYKNNEEDNTLQDIRDAHELTKTTAKHAMKTKDIIYVFGDLQDTPNNSRTFHYGKCRIPKHPLGICKTFETLGLSCTIYRHLDTLEKPIISRHGTKGGRFIDGMYACPQGLERVMGISIINDAGIDSDHALIISNIV